MSCYSPVQTACITSSCSWHTLYVPLPVVVRTSGHHGRVNIFYSNKVWKCAYKMHMSTNSTRHHTQEHECGNLLKSKTTDTTCMEMLTNNVRQRSVAEVTPRCSPLGVVDGPKYSSFSGPWLQPERKGIQCTGLPIQLSPRDQYKAPKTHLDLMLYTM